MEYTPVEQRVLSMMQRTDFKNISKNDILSFASELGKMRPDVAKDIIAQFPAYSAMINQIISECKNELDKILDSDDKSAERFYDTTDKELADLIESRNQRFEMIRNIQEYCNKILESPDISPAQTVEILDKQFEAIKAYDDFCSEIRKREKEIEEAVNKKDSEKRRFHSILAKVVTVTAGIAILAGLNALGGNSSVSLPGKKEEEDAELNSTNDTI